MTSTADSKHPTRLETVAGLLRRPADGWLAARSACWLCALPLLKRTLPLPRLVRLMWLDPRITERDPGREERTIRIVARLSRASGGNCLARSLVLYRYLSRGAADPRLVVGMGKPDEVVGHVWVTVESRPLLETPDTLCGYEEVMAFGHEGARVA